MTPLKRTAFASVALAALALTGCTGDSDTPDPSASASGSGSGVSSGSPSGSASPTLQDQSSALVGGAVPLTEIATTKARSGSSFEGATFHIYGLTRDDRSTVLVWRVEGGGTSKPNDANVRSWENYPIMVTGGKEYSVVTFDKQQDGWSSVSNPVLRLEDGQQAPPQSALYPPLPAGTTEVTLKSSWFSNVKVPVTDAAPTG